MVSRISEPSTVWSCDRLRYTVIQEGLQIFSMEWEIVRNLEDSMMVWLMGEITSWIGSLSHYVSVLLHPKCCFPVALRYYQSVVTVSDFKSQPSILRSFGDTYPLKTFISGKQNQLEVQMVDLPSFEYLTWTSDCVYEKLSEYIWSGLQNFTNLY